MTDFQAFAKRIRDVDWAAGWESPWAVVIVVIVSAILFGLMIPAIQVGTWNDDATYILMAQSILEGKGLRLTYLPTDPLYPVVPAGYPLVLAPIVFLFPNSFLPLKLLSSALLLAAVVLVYYYARPRMGHGFAVLVAALFGTNVAIVQSGAQVMSEALFILSILGAMIQVDRCVELESPGWRDLLLTGSLMTLPLSVRYLGLPIVAALAVYVLWRRRDWRAVVIFAVGLVSWMIINLGLGGWAVAHYYIDRISDLASRLPVLGGDGMASGGMGFNTSGGGWLMQFAENARFLLTNSLPGVIVPLFHGPQVRSLFARWGMSFLPNLAQLSIDALIIVGFAQQVRRKARAAEWALFAYAVTLFLLPINWETLSSRFRYWIPIIPFGYMYLIGTLRAIHGWISGNIRLPRWIENSESVAMFAVVLLLTLNAGRNVQEAVLHPLRERLPDLSTGSEWIRTHSDPDDIVMVHSARVSAVYLDREVVSYIFSSWDSRQIYENLPEWESCISLEGKMEKVINVFGVDYVLINPAIEPEESLHWSRYVEEEVLPYLSQHPDRFSQVWESDDGFTRVYEVENRSSIEEE